MSAFQGQKAILTRAVDHNRTVRSKYGCMGAVIRLRLPYRWDVHVFDFMAVKYTGLDISCYFSEFSVSVSHSIKKCDLDKI